MQQDRGGSISKSSICEPRRKELRFEKYEVGRPAGEDLLKLYRFLGEIFPSDQKLIEQLEKIDDPLPHWRPYALSDGETILGSVSLFSLEVWHQGSTLPLEGVGWVATAPEFRKQGVARYLMNHCLEIVDRERKPSVLFTTIPGAYRGHGFEEVSQLYLETDSQDLSFSLETSPVQQFDRISMEQVERASQIYSVDFPPCEGKVIRRKGDWNMYRMLFNPYPAPHIGFLEQQAEISGYIRFDLEPDRILISELCGSPSNEQGTLALLRFASDFARSKQRTRVTFALPPDHFAWATLRERGLELRKEEGQKATREIFMVRPPVGEDLETLSKLQWSLADKF